MPIMNAQGAMGYARVSRATLPSGLVWINAGSGTVTTYPEYNYAVATDNAGSVIIAGVDQELVSGAARNQAFMAKINSDGTINYARYLDAGAGSDGNYQGIAVDGSNNIYAVGTGYNANPTMLLVKYNSAGVLQWQRFSQVGNTNNNGSDIAVDSAGNSYIIGSYFSSPNRAALITKYDTNGTVQWGKFLQPPTATNNTTGVSIVLDDSGNTYSLITNTTTNYAYIVKLDTSGTTVWQKRINVIGFSSGDSTLAIYGTKLYLGYSGSGASGYRGYILFDFNGNVTQQKSISVGSSILGITTDELGNIYLLGQSVSPNVVYVTKINSSGQFDFARRISSSNIGFFAGSITYKNSSLYIALTSTDGSSAVDFFTLKVPSGPIIPFQGVWPITTSGATYIINYDNYGGTASTSTFNTITGDLTISNSGIATGGSAYANGNRVLNWATAIY